MTNLKIDQQVTFCGLYCGICPMYTREIGETAEKLGRLATASGFDEMAEFVPGMEWFTDFKIKLEWFKTDAVCNGCRDEGRQFHDSCGLRQCCKEKKVDFCHNCHKYPCAVAEEFKIQAPYYEDNLRKIREIGLEDYIREQVVASAGLERDL